MQHNLIVIGTTKALLCLSASWRLNQRHAAVCPNTLACVHCLRRQWYWFGVNRFQRIRWPLKADTNIWWTQISNISLELCYEHGLRSGVLLHLDTRWLNLYTLGLFEWNRGDCPSSNEAPLSNSKWITASWKKNLHIAKQHFARLLSILFRGLVYQHGLTLIPAWISNHMPSKIWDKLPIHSQTSTVAPLTFGNGHVIPSHTL